MSPFSHRLYSDTIPTNLILVISGASFVEVVTRCCREDGEEVHVNLSIQYGKNIWFLLYSLGSRFPIKNLP